MPQVKCIKDVYTDNTQYLSHCEINEALSYPIIKLFTEGKLYDVDIVGKEWRTKDDVCNKKSPYNHIIFSGNPKFMESNDWFLKHFEII